MSKRDDDAQRETLALMQNGQILDALSHEGEKSVTLDELIKQIDSE
jgi:hypothetical protein